MAISLDDLFIDEDGHLACEKPLTEHERNILYAHLFIEWQEMKKNVVKKGIVEDLYYHIPMTGHGSDTCIICHMKVNEHLIFKQKQ